MKLSEAEHLLEIARSMASDLGRRAHALGCVLAHLKKGRGHLLLGFASWAGFVRAEFAISCPRSNRLVAIAEIMSATEVERIGETKSYQVARLSKDQRDALGDVTEIPSRVLEAKVTEILNASGTVFRGPHSRRDLTKAVQGATFARAARGPVGTIAKLEKMVDLLEKGRGDDALRVARHALNELRPRLGRVA